MGTHDWTYDSFHWISEYICRRPRHHVNVYTNPTYIYMYSYSVLHWKHMVAYTVWNITLRPIMRPLMQNLDDFATFLTATLNNYYILILGRNVYYTLTWKYPIITKCQMVKMSACTMPFVWNVMCFCYRGVQYNITEKYQWQFPWCLLSF